MKNLSPWTTSGALAVVALAGLAAWSTTPLRGQDRSFAEVVDVEMVDLEVWVTDSKGRPVSGLAPGDFSIREDGEAKDLVAFAEIRSGAPVATSATPGSPEERPAPAPAPRSETTRPSVVIFLDQGNMGRANLKRMVGAIRKLVDDAGLPTERLLLLRHDDALITEVPFGSSSESLREALDRLEEEEGPGATPGREKRQTAMALEREWAMALELRDPCLVYPQRAAGIILGYAEPTLQRSLATVRQLITVSRFLAGRPGPKTLIYFGDTLEVAPGASFVRLVDEKCPRQREIRRIDLPVLSDAYEELTHLANANRLTLSMLQSSGLGASLLGGPESRYRVDSSIEFELRTASRAGLGFLADRTGGRLLPNRNRVARVLEEAVRETESYYSLAYVPDHPAEDADHRLEVEVRGRGLKVRHRRSYRHKTAEERMADLLQSALYLGITSNPLEARLGSAGYRRADGSDELVVSLRLMVPVEKAVFLPSTDGETARFRLQLLAGGERNAVADARQLTYSFQRARLPEEAAYLTLPLEVALPPGRFVLAVAVRDEASRETSYVATTIGLDPEATAGPAS